MEQNKERYEFLKWGQENLDNFKIVPPGTGICHQVNLENLAKVAWFNEDNLVYPDTCVGTDSHTTMVNGIGVLGWGVGGIEAESVMLGESISLLLPEVIGFKLIGRLKEGVTATDLALTVTQILRKKGVVDKFVEFFGSGVESLPISDRATIANMAPEYGATCGIFPVDNKTLEYLRQTARSEEQIALIKAYFHAQGMFGAQNEAVYTDIIELDLSSVEACLAGPKRPQDRVNLSKVAIEYRKALLEAKKGLILETQNLLIRPFSEADLEDLHTLHEDKNVVQLVGATDINGTQNWLNMLLEQYQKHGFSQFYVSEKSSGKFVGKAGFLEISNEARKPLEKAHLGKNEYSAFLKTEVIGRYEAELAKALLEWYENNYETELFAYGFESDEVRVDIYKNLEFTEILRENARIAYTVPIKPKKAVLRDGSVVIAAITSCTNTSNPSVLIAAGLLAKKAVEAGLSVPNFVKTSLAPGSRAVEAYLINSGLQKYLDKLGFNIVGFGCTTCIGNSGPLQEDFESEINKNGLYVGAVISGNRNFEGRVHPLVKANFLASPPLVVAYALVGHLNKNIAREPIGKDLNGKNVYLRDIWPTNEEIEQAVNKFVRREIFEEKYANVFEGTKEWQSIYTKKADIFEWNADSTYIENPPYFENINEENVLDDIKNARILLLLGDSVTTDHISPAGNIAKDSPAGKFLTEKNISYPDFNSYGARRGSHSVMMRGTFANIRIKNEIAEGREGWWTKDFKTGQIKPIYEVAMESKEAKTPLIVIAGKEYGTGSSRDWAAKGTKLLGVKAVIAESFERIHRSNLIGMGVVPFTFINGFTRADLQLSGLETFEIIGIKELGIEKKCVLRVCHADGLVREIEILARVNTQTELDFLRSGGIMQYVVKKY
jgi:aconitase A